MEDSSPSERPENNKGPKGETSVAQHQNIERKESAADLKPSRGGTAGEILY